MVCRVHWNCVVHYSANMRNTAGHSLPGNSHLQPNKEWEKGEEESGRGPDRGAMPTVCIARPKHRQEPHTGMCVTVHACMWGGCINRWYAFSLCAFPSSSTRLRVCVCVCVRVCVCTCVCVCCVQCHYELAKYVSAIHQCLLCPIHHLLCAPLH